MIRARPRVGPAAKRAASASTSASSWSSSTAFQIRPHSAACSAASGSPVSARPSARAWPTRRGSTQVPPLSGNQADRGEGLDELGALRGDDDVAGERDIGAGAGGDAVDPRDHRHRQRRSACGSADCSAARPTRRDRPPRPAPPRGRSDPARRRSRGRRRSGPASARSPRLASASATSSCICTVKLFSRSGRFRVSRAMPASSLNVDGFVSHGAPMTANETGGQGRALDAGRRGHRPGLGDRDRGGARRLCADPHDASRRHAERPRHRPWRHGLRARRHRLRLCLQQPQSAQRRRPGLDHLPRPGARKARC